MTESTQRSGRSFLLPLGVVLLATPVVLGLAGVIDGWYGQTIGGAAAAIGLGTILFWVVMRGRRVDDAVAAVADDDDERSVWDAIPSWQYEGRHVESGGMSRAEQERALSEIEERAREIEESGEAAVPDRGVDERGR